MRRGLVIVGGGAKGAYSFGCMKVLREAGFRFEAVSGTSAGSLNAAIWSTGDMEAGEKLWSGVSPDTSYRRSRLLGILPRPLARLVGTGGVLMSLLIARMRGYAIDGTHDALVGYAVFAATLIVGTLAVVAFSDATLKDAGIAGLMFSLFLWPVIGGGGPRRGRKSLRILLFIICLLAILLIAPYALKAFVPHDLSPLHLIWAGPLALAAILASALIVWSLLDRALGPLRSLTVLDSAPLRATLTDFLATRPLEVPTFVTAARSVDVFDPDAPVWIAENNTGASLTGADLIGPWKPFPDACWVPQYVRIDGQPPYVVTEWLMATAALPFGIVGSVRIAEEEYVDGGVVDNAPILPLLAYQLDEVIVLELSPASPGRASHEERCARLQRLIGLAALPHPPIQHTKPSRIRHDPPQLAPLPSFDRFPAIQEIRPARRLGGIFGGTLNFAAPYARTLIAQGEADTRRWLEDATQAPVA
jgi:hypothetical protein